MESMGAFSLLQGQHYHSELFITLALAILRCARPT
jgi:hypothetical protein